MPPNDDILSKLLAETRKNTADLATIQADLRKLSGDVRHLNRVVLTGNNAQPLLVEVELLKQRLDNISKQSNESVVDRKRILSDIRELKEEAVEVKTQVILLERDVKEQGADIQESRRISQVSISNELELEHIARVSTEKAKAEKTTGIVKIAFAILVPVITIVFGYIASIFGKK